MGCSILFNLAKRGVKDTVLVERDVLGAGSTGRSSGVIRMHYSSEINTRLAWESLKTLQNFQEIVGGDPAFEKTGFMLFVPPDASEAFKQNIAMQQSMGINTRIISRQEARDIAPYISIEDSDGICYEPDSGYADPPSVGQAYATAARDMGAELVLGNPALEVEIKNGKVTGVLTAKGRIETDTAVLASGPWTGRMMKKLGFDLPLVAERHEIFFLKRSLSKLPGHVVVGDLVNMAYCRPESHDLTLVGNGNIYEDVDPDDYNQKVSMSFVEEIWPRIAKRMPDLEDAEFFTGYAGLYTTTPDHHPVIDKVDGIYGLYICTGFSGHGFKEAPIVGALVSEMIVDGEARTIDISSLGMDRFEKGTLNETKYAFKVIA